MMHFNHNFARKGRVCRVLACVVVLIARYRCVLALPNRAAQRYNAGTGRQGDLCGSLVCIIFPINEVWRCISVASAGLRSIFFQVSVWRHLGLRHRICKHNFEQGASPPVLRWYQMYFGCYHAGMSGILPADS